MKKMFAFFSGCAILSLWGISAVGSASHWQCEGHGFESRMLQDVKKSQLRVFAGKSRVCDFLIQLCPQEI